MGKISVLVSYYLVGKYISALNVYAAAAENFIGKLRHYNKYP